MERAGRAKRSGDPGGVREVVGTPGKSTLTSHLPVQGQAPTTAGAVQAAAARGIATPATTLPHAERIQASLGSAYDVSSIQAHVDGGAAEACADMGASAFASGSHVAFWGMPDLHTAAHETAHVVQQAHGVNLHGGVGATGDAYERQADEVADGVVAGRSVAELFGVRGTRPAPITGQNLPVQKKDGEIAHHGHVGAGNVTARKNDVHPHDKTLTHEYSLEYAGKDADQAHWLQFVNFTMYAEVPGQAKVYYTGSATTSSGIKPFSTDKVTNWSVDSDSTSDPYYEAGFANVRTPKQGTKIFDRPGGASIEPLAVNLVATTAMKATKVTFIAVFDTYLVLDGKATYHVAWSATTVYDPVQKISGTIVYGTGSSGAVTALPENLKTVLDTKYADNKIQ
jgi:hypothetical protein